MNFLGYRCSRCSREYSPGEATYLCPADGGNLDVVLDYNKLRDRVDRRALRASSRQSIWRYQALLPAEAPGPEDTPMSAVGWTPIYEEPALATELGLGRVWLKDEGRNPTGSLKDRASAVVLARAKEIAAPVIVTASTGNAGAALAGLAAACGQRSVILAPRSAPSAKVAQLLIYGAAVLLVEGNYDQAFDLSIEASKEFGWYCRNTGYNPFTVEGKKTAAYEIWEQVLEDGPVARPDLAPPAVVVSVGDGNIITGLQKGFHDLHALGWLDRVPRLFGVQAKGSAAIASAWQRGSEEIVPVSARTLADSISVDLPRDGARAVRAVVQSGGAYLTVSDADILKAMVDLGRVGVFAEPAAAAAYAGLRQAVREGRLGEEDRVVVLITGSGLKDVRAAAEAVGEAKVIEASLGAVKSALGL
ncbi:MAG: threonine synthase [Anaerolineales bacterium]|jgi:threonine synthase